jgi:hypothetical protein
MEYKMGRKDKTLLSLLVAGLASAFVGLCGFGLTRDLDWLYGILIGVALLGIVVALKD